MVEPRSNSNIGRWLWIALRSLTVSAALIGLIDAVGIPSRAAWAEVNLPGETPPPAGEEPEHEPPPEAGAIDRAHAMISFGITDTADRIDAFLGDARIQDESNRSNLKLAVLRISDENGLEIKPDFKLKIVLPRLRRRLQLVIAREDDPEEEPQSQSAKGGVGEVVTGTPSGDLTSAIRLMLRASRDINIYIDTGIRFRLHPVVFSRVRYRRSVELDRWALRFTQSVKWEEVFLDNSYHWEVISQLNIERPITPNTFFRTTLQGAWYEGRHGYFVTQGFALVHRIGEHRVLVYEWNTAARTGRIIKTENDTEIVVDPDKRFRVEETGPKLRYRQTLGRPWFFIEADAERAFRRDLDPDSEFEGVWRFLVKIEVQFRDMGPGK
jgi:hypothetical protein